MRNDVLKPLNMIVNRKQFFLGSFGQIIIDFILATKIIKTLNAKLWNIIEYNCPYRVGFRCDIFSTIWGLEGAPLILPAHDLTKQLLLCILLNYWSIAHIS